MNDRNRRPPVALARDAPVAKPPGDLLVAEALRFQVGGDGVHRALIIEAVVLARIDAAAVVGVPGLPGAGRVGSAFDVDHRLDRQAVFLRERKIALVVPGHAHYCPFPVGHKHVVADPNFDFFAGDRVGDEKSRRHAFLVEQRELGLHHRAALAFLHESGELRVRSRRVRCERMFGGHRAERGAHQRVGARGEDAQELLLPAQLVWEADIDAVALADPVGLHRLHALGPSRELVERCEELLGVSGDAHVIHRDLALFDGRAGAPAAAVDHLLVREHGLVQSMAKPSDRSCFFMYAMFS